MLPLVNKLSWDSLHVRRLIQQSCMFYRIQYGLVHITPPACIQRATHISARTDHPLKYINTFIPTINAYKYAFYPCVIGVWNRLPPAAVLHIAPSVSVFKSIAAPAIREMQPLHGLHISAVVDTMFVDIYVDTKNIPTCRYNIQHIDKRTMRALMNRY